MQRFIIEGGRALKGTVHPQGAKNEALQVICASILTDEWVYFRNVPNILDVVLLLDLLKFLAVSVRQESSHAYALCAASLDPEKLRLSAFQEKVSHIRGSLLLLGPLLARHGWAVLSRPGGDRIGQRPIDTHLTALGKLGVRYAYDGKTSQYTLHREGSKLYGNNILMDDASVTGTANVIMGAVLAEGNTTIRHAASEPYVQQLCTMLNNMGASIDGIGSNFLRIRGVHSLKGATHTLLPDMIEVGSFIGMAAATQSEIRIEQAGVPQLEAILQMFRRLGIQVAVKGDDLLTVPQDLYTIQKTIDGGIPTISDSIWPGLSPDMIGVGIVSAVHAEGEVLFYQKMFESRLFFVDHLIRMGAQIILCDPHRVVIVGLGRKRSLRGIDMSSPDIRAGISLVISALAAKGTSIIHNTVQIDRGYEDLVGRLSKLNANIKKA